VPFGCEVKTLPVPLPHRDPGELTPEKLSFSLLCIALVANCAMLAPRLEWRLGLLATCAALALMVQSWGHRRWRIAAQGIRVRGRELPWGDIQAATVLGSRSWRITTRQGRYLL